jgi:hypothetical protein
MKNATFTITAIEPGKRPFNSTTHSGTWGNFIGRSAASDVWGIVTEQIPALVKKYDRVELTAMAYDVETFQDIPWRDGAGHFWVWTEEVWLDNSTKAKRVKHYCYQEGNQVSTDVTPELWMYLLGCAAITIADIQNQIGAQS